MNWLAGLLGLLLAATPAAASDLWPADKAWALQDYDQAIRLYQAAALAGDHVAQRRLGDLFGSPARLVHPDPTEAARWYAMAAAQGDDLAQDALGLLYRDGNGVRRDDAEALKWLRRAAAQDNFMAQFHLGQMYQAGRGVPQDDFHAFVWYSLSAPYDAGNIAAAARDETARNLTPQQLAKARKLALTCLLSAYRNCD